MPVKAEPSPMRAAWSNPMRGILIASILTVFPSSVVCQRVEDVAFLAGAWQSVGGDGTVTYEVWTGPEGGLMVGLGKTVQPGGSTSFEYTRVLMTPDGLAFVAQPNGVPPTAFALKELSSGRAVFENSAHDFPQVVTYWTCETDLCARIEGRVDGRREQLEWRYQRMQVQPSN